MGTEGNKGHGDLRFRGMEKRHVGPERRLDGADDSVHERTILVGASITDAFDFLADGRHDPLWLPWISRSHLEEFGGGVGAAYAQVVTDSAFGQPDFAYRVVHYRRPVMLGIEVVSLVLHPTATYRLTPLEPTSTAITLTGAVPNSRGAEPDQGAAQHWVGLLLEGLPSLKACLEGWPGLS